MNWLSIDLTPTKKKKEKKAQKVCVCFRMCFVFRNCTKKEYTKDHKNHRTLNTTNDLKGKKFLVARGKSNFSVFFFFVYSKKNVYWDFGPAPIACINSKSATGKNKLFFEKKKKKILEFWDCEIIWNWLTMKHC